MEDREPARQNVKTKFSRLVYDRAIQLAKITAVIYSIRRWNKVPPQSAKKFYIFVLSPLLLTEAILHSDSISYNYRKFLLNFTYPESKLDKDDVLSHCGNFHPKQSCCVKALKENIHTTVRSVVKMYVKLYALHGLILYVMSRKIFKITIAPRLKLYDVAKLELVNTFRSTAFLAGQTILQRILLCIASSYGVKLDRVKLFLISMIGSLPIIAERDFRAQQVNNLVLSHLVIGYLRKKSKCASLEQQHPVASRQDEFGKLPWWIFANTILADGFSVQPITFLISMLTSVTF